MGEPPLYLVIMPQITLAGKQKQEVAKSACEGNQSGELGKQDRAVS
jgi:hypothetical protein